jgi:hypothetical protein
MPIDLATLATTVVATFLVPYAKVGMQKLAEGLGQEVGKASAQHAGQVTGQIWQRVKAAFSSPKEQTTLDLFQEEPDEMKGLLIKKLREKLEQDPDLAQTLAGLINQPGPEGNTGAQIMNAGLAGVADLRHADLSHARDMNIAGVMMGDTGTDPDPSDPSEE